MKVSPSILACDFSNLCAQIDVISSEVEYLHIDVMDGAFVPNISFGIPVVKSLRPHYKNVFDTHLMIEHPLKYIEPFKKAGSDLITFHLESKDDAIEVINKIHECGLKAGISIKPNTPVEELIPYLDKVELILIMSVEPGFGGQKFNPNAVDKIKWLAERKKDYNYEIEVDGGINEETGRLCLDAGCDVLVAGSYIFQANDPKGAVKSLR